MENTFGGFLRQKRREMNLTQKELAKLLFVSESTVSKWEKDVAHPDITLLPKLSEMLGVSEHELITASVDTESREEKVQAKKWRTLSTSWEIFFYISYVLALVPCFICNLAINKTLSWFWIVFCALLLSFTFTNLPKLVKKYKLILMPLSNFAALCLLLGVCAVYTEGNWFWIAVLPVLFALIAIFTPIYISKYGKSPKIKKYNDFISLCVDFIALNLLLFVIDIYTVVNGYAIQHWYPTMALPITSYVYVCLNLILGVRLLKINHAFKTGFILLLVNFFIYIVPSFIKVNDPAWQKELDDLNIFKADLSLWQAETALENNVHCIVFLTVLILAVAFLIGGLIVYLKRKNRNGD